MLPPHIGLRREATPLALPSHPKDPGFEGVKKNLDPGLNTATLSFCDLDESLAISGPLFFPLPNGASG